MAGGSHAPQCAVVAGCDLSRVDCLGKELFLLLIAGDTASRRCLRLHFGMNGSSRLYAPGAACAPTAFEARKALTLELHTCSGGVLRFYDATATMRDAEEVEVGPPTSPDRRRAEL